MQLSTNLEHRFPAYHWVIMFCASRRLDELAGDIRQHAERIYSEHGDAGMTGYADYLRALVLEAAPGYRAQIDALEGTDAWARPH